MNRVTNEEPVEDHKENFEWSSRKQHILFFFAYVMAYSADCSILLQSIDGGIDNFHKGVQLLIFTIFVGAPILFLQISIGQYTRNSCLILGEMFPIFYGIGYCMLFLSLCEVSKQMFYTSKLVCYTIMILCNTFPAWMKCYKYLFKDFPNCISRKEIDQCGTHSGSDEPCYKPHSVILSAEIFKDGIVFGRIKLTATFSDGSNVWMMSDTFFLIAFCLSNTAIVFLFLILGTSKNIKNVYTSLKAGIILCLGLLISIGVTLVIQPGISRGFNELKQHFVHSDVLEPHSWVSALTAMVKSLRLAEGGHILMGSFIPADKPDFWIFLALIGVYIAAIAFFSLYYYLFLGLLIYKLSMKIEDLILETEENIIFVLFPTFLGILPSCYFLSLVFFIAFVLLSFFSMVVKILILEQGITKYFNLSQYFVYFRYTICFIIAILGLCMEKNEIAALFLDLQTLYGIACVLVVAVQQIMIIVYGIQNVFDDIEYIMKIRLKVLLQMMWILTPLFCFVIAANIGTNMDFRRNMGIKTAFVTIIIIPIVIALIKQVFHLAKRKNLIGLLRPTERYGPPNVEDRILRVLYNTRLMVKYRKYKEVCNHECLMKSHAVKIALEEELQQINHFENALKLKSKNKAWEEKISLQFRQHKKHLLKFIQKYPTNKDVKFKSVIRGDLEEDDE